MYRHLFATKSPDFLHARWSRIPDFNSTGRELKDEAIKFAHQEIRNADPPQNPHDPCSQNPPKPLPIPTRTLTFGGG